MAARAEKAIAVINKSDLPQSMDEKVLPENFDAVVHVSAKQGDGLDALANAVSTLFPVPDAPAGEILTNARQADAVRRALDSLRAAREAMRDGVTPDAVLTEAESAQHALGELNGRSVSDDITDRIFSRFCVGK